MLKDSISKEQVLALAGEVAGGLTAATIQRGWDYYRRGQVYNVVVAGDKVQATVEGTYRYLVLIDLKDFTRSRCSCPVQRRCKHLAAVFLCLYAIHGLPGEFVQNLDSCAHRISKPAPVAVVKKSGPAESGTWEEWQAYFAAEFQQQIGVLHSTIYYLSPESLSFGAFFREVEKHSRRWSEPVKHFFLFQASTFAMEQLDKHAARYFSNYPGYFPRELGDLQTYYMDRLFETAGEFPLQDHKSHASYFRQIITALREKFLREGTAFFNWRLIYRLLWSNAFWHEPWVETEIAELEKILRKKNTAAQLKYSAALGLAHFAFQTGHDRQALEWLERNGEFEFEDLFLYIYSFRHSKALTRWRELLYWLTGHIHGRINSDFAKTCASWLELAAEEQFQAEALEVLKTLLPRSSSYYQQGLLQAGRFKTWVNLHIFQQSFESVETKDLRLIEAVDVSLLLPLYHQQIISLIEQRNRKSYRSAVHLLKKLRTYYKKLKRLGEWEHYLARLTGRYSRMRALQEELSKGKLA